MADENRRFYVLTRSCLQGRQSQRLQVGKQALRWFNDTSPGVKPHIFEPIHAAPSTSLRAGSEGPLSIQNQR
jgi:hypothetical protein